jgi:hypothetical protein
LTCSFDLSPAFLGRLRDDRFQLTPFAPKENREGDSDDWQHGAKLVDEPSAIAGFLG